MSKRQEMREKRKKQQRLNRFAAVGMTVLGAVALAAVLISTQIAQNRPAGPFVTVEPNDYPLANGLAIGARMRLYEWMSGKISNARLA